MSIMAKTPSGYKKIGSAYLGERPVDKVFNANGDVVYALQRELTGVPPLLFKGKEQSELLNYRIYGDTVDGESVGDRTGDLFDGEIMIGGLSDSTGSEVDGILTRLRTSWIKVEPSETYSFNLNNLDYKIRNIYVYDESKSFIYTSEISSNSATVTVSALASYVRFVFRKNDGSETVTISDCREKFMFNTGSTPLPYEPYGYKVPVTVKGKNLFNNIWEQGNIRADNGQKEASNIMICSDYFPVEYDKTYSISRTIFEGYNNVRGYDASKNYIGGGTTVCSVNNPFANASTKKGIFKITNSLVAFVKFNHYTNNLNMKYMIVEGDYTNTPIPPYEPYREPVITNLYLPEPLKMVGGEAEYVDFVEQKLHRVRKNLLPITAKTQTVSGVTFTVNNDGSVTCNGTATAMIQFPINTLALFVITENVILSGCPHMGSTNTFLLRVMYPQGVASKSDTGNGAFIQKEYGDSVRVQIRIASGYTCDNLTFYPMIRKANVGDDSYEPYIENTEVDVTLPALPTIKGTNQMSIDTEVQPSRMDIEGRIKSLT